MLVCIIQLLSFLPRPSASVTGPNEFYIYFHLYATALGLGVDAGVYNFVVFSLVPMLFKLLADMYNIGLRPRNSFKWVSITEKTFQLLAFDLGISMHTFQPIIPPSACGLGVPLIMVFLGIWPRNSNVQQFQSIILPSAYGLGIPSNNV